MFSNFRFYKYVYWFEMIIIELDWFAFCFYFTLFQNWDFLKETSWNALMLTIHYIAWYITLAKIKVWQSWIYKLPNMNIQMRKIANNLFLWCDFSHMWSFSFAMICDILARQHIIVEFRAHFHIEKYIHFETHIIGNLSQIQINL